MREDALPQPVSPYGVTKLAAEQLCYLYYVNYGVPAASLRYFTVYGPRQRPDMAFHRFLRAALDGEPIALYGDGEQTRDFTFVADAVAATIAAGERGVPGRVVQHRRRLARLDQRRARRSSSGSPGARCRCAASRRRRGTCATPTPTRRWRARDLGIRADRVARRRNRGGVSMAVDNIRAAMTRARLLMRAARWSRSLLLAALPRACASGPQKPPIGAARARQVPVRARHRRAERQEAGSPPASTSGSSSTATRRARIAPTRSSDRRHLPRRRRRPSRYVLAINEFREFLDFYPDAHRAPTTRSSSWRWRTSTRCAAPMRDQTETRDAIRELDGLRRSAIPNSS